MSGANLERMGEALYNLSDSLRESGFLDDSKPAHQDRYNAVVRAWHGLAAAHERLLASVDRSGEAGETSTQIEGSTEGESAVGDSRDAQNTSEAS